MRLCIAAADAIEARAAEILAANEKDCAVAQRAVERGEMSRALFARLRTTERGIAEMAMRVREVAELPDPLHRRLSAMELDEDLVLYKETCPLGVVGVVFESRPDVVPQISSLALKSGNAVCLKGGAEAIETNAVLVCDLARRALGFSRYSGGFGRAVPHARRRGADPDAAR